MFPCPGNEAKSEPEYGSFSFCSVTGQGNILSTNILVLARVQHKCKHIAQPGHKGKLAKQCLLVKYCLTATLQCRVLHRLHFKYSLGFLLPFTSFGQKLYNLFTCTFTRWKNCYSNINHQMFLLRNFLRPAQNLNAENQANLN